MEKQHALPEEVSILEKTTVLMDFGSRQPKFDYNRPIRQVIAANPDFSFIPVQGGQLIDFEGIDRTNTLMIAATSTANIELYEQAGIEVYPSSEFIKWVSNKWNLYEWCRKNNIPTVLSLKLVQNTYSNPTLGNKLKRMHKKLGGVVLKPEQSYGPHRDLIEPIASSSTGIFDDYLSQGMNHKLDMVTQKEVLGLAKKVFGSWPGQWFYLDADDQVKPCPPNIKRTCDRISETMNFPFGGIDFMDDRGVWELIDINPPGAGRQLPSLHDLEKLSVAVKDRIAALVHHEEIPKKSKKIKVMLAAAGEGKRLMSVSEGLPKALLEVKNGKTVVDYSTEIALQLTKNDGFISEIDIMVMPDKVEDFVKWKRDRNSSIINIKSPNPDLYTNPSSYNHVLATLPEETDYVLMLSADRIIHADIEVLNTVAAQINASFAQGLAFVFVGIPDEQSKHRFILDKDGRIIGYVENSEQGVGLKKVAFALDVAKTTVTSASNTFNVIDQMTRAGSLGKCILLPEGSIIHDIDTPSDLDEARNS